MKHYVSTRLSCLFLAFLLIAAVGMLGACTEPYNPTEATIVETKTVGTGGKTITVSVVNDKNEATHYTVKTDAEMLDRALLDNGIVEGEIGQYGLFITSAGGLVAEGNGWWGIYVGDGMADTGASFIKVADGGSYAVVYKVGW